MFLNVNFLPEVANVSECIRDWWCLIHYNSAELWSLNMIYLPVIGEIDTSPGPRPEAGAGTRASNKASWGLR